MSGWFLASYVALWILVCVLVVALLALYNHFGQMYISSPQGRAAHGPDEGAPLPVTEARDTRDREVTIPSPGRQAVILFATTHCPLCNEMKPDLVRFATAHFECDVLVVCGGDRRAVARWSRDVPPPVVVVPDKASSIATRYRISLTPFLVVTSGGGVVLSRGLVNNEEDLEMALSLARNGDESRGEIQTLTEA